MSQLIDLASSQCPPTRAASLADHETLSFVTAS